MRVRVSFVVNPDENFRKALRAYTGKEGLASREEIKRWYQAAAFSMDDDMLHDFFMQDVPKEDQWKHDYSSL